MLLRQVDVFLTILDKGSFTLAAEYLNMTQPTVSHSMSALEKSLGLRLLTRGRTGVYLTPDGHRLLPHFQRLARAAEHLWEEANRAPDTVAGKVRIGSFPSTSIHVLLPIIRTLAEQHPSVEVLIFEGLPDQIAQWLEQDAIDLGFLEFPYPDQYDCRPILADEYQVIVPPGHPLATRKQVPLHQLSGEPFILSKFGCEPVLRTAFHEASATMNVTYEVRDLATLFAMVREGLGISMVPELLLTQVPQDLAVLRLTPAVQREIGLAHPRGALLSLPVKTVHTAILSGAEPARARI